MVEKYYNENGEVGILVSYGFGAGWSTWGYGIEMAIDKRIINKFLELSEKNNLGIIEYKDIESEFEQLFNEIKPNEHVYLGGIDGLTLEFVPSGTSIEITEYDGSEFLKIGYSDFTTL